MKVLLGWSQEVETNHWERIDVELDETDLRAVLAENVPELESDALINPGLKFVLMKTEIERLILVHQFDKGLVTKADANQALSENKAKRAQVFEKVRSEYIS